MTLLHRSPARVTSQAASPIPRSGFVLLIILFSFIGLFGRDLWQEDAAGFGRMWTIAHGDRLDWFIPNLAGAVEPTGGGPLAYWVGALGIKWLGPILGDLNAALSINLIWIPFILFSLWISIFRFARRDEAQPVVGAFGGEASRIAYARLVADIGVLLTLGTLGMVWRFHQTSTDNAALACVSLALLALSLLEWHWLIACFLAGLACAGYALAQSPLAGLGLLLGVAIALIFSRRAANLSLTSLLFGLAGLVLTALAIPGLWLFGAFQLAPTQAALYLDGWLVFDYTQGVAGKDLVWLLRDGSWFFWPLWPLAIWGTYAWRNSLAQAHFFRPLLILCGLLAGAVFSGVFNEGLMAAVLIPLVPLAAFGTTCTRRAMDNLVDWLAIALFSLAQLVLWLYYFAWVNGYPRPMANSVNRLAPGFIEHPHWYLLLLTALAGLGWLYLVSWRISTRPRVMWRGPLLAAAGVTVVWLQVNLLYLPGLNYVFSFQPFVLDVSTELRKHGLQNECVLTQQVPASERAVLAFNGGIHFSREGRHDLCRVAITHDVHRSSLDDIAPPGETGSWQLIWETRRRTKPDEHWQLWVKKP